MKITSSQLISEAVFTYSIDRFDAEILLAHTLKTSREFVIANPNFVVPLVKYFFAKKFIKARSKGIPIAYITGHKQFFGLDFLVNTSTLVPRPDTEILVESVLTELKDTRSKIDNKSAFIVDIGTGSGCIPISLWKTLKEQKQISNLQFIATDISKKALGVAKKNAKKHGTDIRFLKGNLFQPLLTQNIFLEDKNIILTANLPYLTQKQFDEEISIQYEPHRALVAKDNGLALYKKLLEQMQQFLKATHIQCTCFFEIDPLQTKHLSSYIKNIFPNGKIEIIKDLTGVQRILKIHLSFPSDKIL